MPRVRASVAVTRVAAGWALLVLQSAWNAAMMLVLYPSSLKMFLLPVYARCLQSQ